MVRIRSGWLVAVAALGLGTRRVQEERRQGRQTGSGTTTTTTTTTPVTRRPRSPCAGADDLSLLPVDSEMVMGLNFAQLQQSALWKQFSPKLMEKAAGGLAEFKATCGFDPLEAVKSVSMGLKGLGGDAPDGAIVVHGLDKAKVMACVDKAKDEAAKKGTEITVDGDVFIVKDKSVSRSRSRSSTTRHAARRRSARRAPRTRVIAAAKGTSTLKTLAVVRRHVLARSTRTTRCGCSMNGNSPPFCEGRRDGRQAQGGVRLGQRDRRPHGRHAHPPRHAGRGEPARQHGCRARSTTRRSSRCSTSSTSPPTARTPKFVDRDVATQKLQQLIGMVGGMMGGMMGGGDGRPLSVAAAL